MSGFYIKRLIVSNGSDQASIELRPGANLITGDSDTGKSYIFSAINYVLGRSAPPKEIIESKGYDDIYLELVTFSEKKLYTLHRIIGKKEINVTSESSDELGSRKRETYTTTGTVDSPNHISTFLLGLARLDGKKLLRNKKQGITQNLSIKTILSLTFVDETSIIKETSPYYFSEQHQDKILSQSLLHLLLTQEDFSQVVKNEDPKIKETRISGKLEFLDSQISHYAVYKDTLVDKFDQSVGHNEREKFLQLDTELQKNIQEAKELTERKNDILSKKEILLGDRKYNYELQNRFSILERQYRSDVERIDFILEAKSLSDQLGDVVCPLCTSPLDSSHLDHIKENDQFVAAAIQELAKCKSKLAGLNDTINELKTEEELIMSKILTIDEHLMALEETLSGNFSSKIQSIKSDLKEYIEIENVANEISFIEKQLKTLFQERNRLEKALKTKDSVEDVTILSYTLLSDLSEAVSKRLKNWNYESHVDVNFNSDYKVFDIVISGKNRRSYGKGKRSISYAACLMGLLDLCYEKQSTFTYLLMFDSPLTTYEEKKRQSFNPKDVLQGNILKSFFKDIVKLPKSSQVIILDNKEPDSETLKEIKNDINIITFTGLKEVGRAGFF